MGAMRIPAALHRIPWEAVFLLLLVCAVFAVSVVRNGFVDIDDNILVVQNPVSHGITLQNLWLAFSMFDPELYIPFTFVSFQANYALHGLWAPGYHVVNALLHAGSAICLWAIGCRLTGSKRVALLSAAVFAVHPINVEAVAWVSGRKDVLASFFGLVSLWLWLTWLRNDRKQTYGLSLAVYGASLLSKVSLAVLPVLLILLPLTGITDERKKSVRGSVPYFVLSAAFIAVALLGKEGKGAGTLFEKLLIGSRAATLYLQKLFWPDSLGIFYPFTEKISLLTPSISSSILFLVSISAIVIAARRRWPAAAVAWASYLMLLAPSFTNFSKGHDLFRDIYIGSDRYAYLALVPIVWVILSAAERVAGRHRRLVTGACFALLVPLSVLSYRQSLTWKDPETLFSQAVEAAPNSAIGWGTLGSIRFTQGKREEAMLFFQKSLAIRPTNIVLFNLGVIAEEGGVYDQAEAFLRKALEQRPWDAETLTHLGNVLLQRNANDEAFAMYAKAILVKAPPVDAFLGLGKTAERLGKRDDAIAAYRDALTKDPGNQEATKGLARLGAQ